MKLREVPKELQKIWEKQYEDYVRFGGTTDITYIDWLQKKYNIELDDEQ